MRFEDKTRTRMRRALLDRGLVLSTLLSEVLAGKANEARLNLLGGKPGMRPAEKLRWALDQVERRRIMLDSNDDAFGRCDECGVDIGELALGEMPWADRCQAHSTHNREQ
jgi:hypothetical protein